MKITNIKTAFINEAIENAGLPYGVDNRCKISTIKKLAQAEQRSHAKFLRQMQICFNVSAPISWWVEFDTYKIGVTRMSTGIMHSVLKHGVKESDFSEHTDKNLVNYAILLVSEIINQYEDKKITIREAKTRIKDILPAGFIYNSFVTTNYEVLRNIYKDRKDHQLIYWQDFFNSFLKIPYSELIFNEKLS